MLYTTEAEYITAISDTKVAISRALNIGHTHLNRSGGSERSTTEESLTNLRKHLALLQREYATLVADNNNKPLSCRFGADW